MTQFSRSPSSLTVEIDTYWPSTPNLSNLNGRCFTYYWNLDTDGVPGDNFKLTIVGDAGGCGTPYPDGVDSLWLTDLSTATMTRLPDSSFTNKVIQSHGVLTATISLSAIGLSRSLTFSWSAGTTDPIGADTTNFVTHTLG